VPYQRGELKEIALLATGYVYQSGIKAVGYSDNFNPTRKNRRGEKTYEIVQGKIVGIRMAKLCYYLLD
jgi:hypothetical protein